MLSTFARPSRVHHAHEHHRHHGRGRGEAEESAVKWGIAIDMVMTWVLTFPGCGLMGFVIARLFLLFS